MKLLCSLFRTILSLALTLFGILSLLVAFDHYLRDKLPPKYVVFEDEV